MRAEKEKVGTLRHLKVMNREPRMVRRSARSWPMVA